MKYVLLICANEQTIGALPEPELAARRDAWTAYRQELAAANKLLGAERLRPVSAATTVRRNGGPTPLVSDGPFAETKEQLGGYFLIEARDLDEAVEWANKMPHLADADSAVEIRPIWPM